MVGGQDRQQQQNPPNGDARTGGNTSITQSGSGIQETIARIREGVRDGMGSPPSDQAGGEAASLWT